MPCTVVVCPQAHRDAARDRFTAAKEHAAAPDKELLSALRVHISTPSVDLLVDPEGLDHQEVERLLAHANRFSSDRSVAVAESASELMLQLQQLPVGVYRCIVWCGVCEGLQGGMQRQGVLRVHGMGGRDTVSTDARGAVQQRGKHTFSILATPFRIAGRSQRDMQR